MEINELRKLSIEDLKKRLIEKKEELFSKKMLAASGTLEKPVVLRQLRREIARIKTILNERKMEGEK
ncbi:MAG: 50S ribosomal protein L29 [Mollicutes bacterium]|nr:50S ribosomal protein L29 [Mollicutes bacterium]